MATAHTAGFRWLPSYYEVVRDLPDNERLAIYDAIPDFGFGNKVQDLPPLLNGYFLLMRPSIEKSIRFEEKQVENGKKGGRPPKPTRNPDETQNNPDETQSDFGENLAIAVANDVAVSNEKDSGKPQHSLRNKYGEYGWIMLTDKEYRKLLDELGRPELERCIQYVDELAQSSNNKNKWRDWNLVIRRCHREGWGRKPEALKPADSWPGRANIPRAY